MWREREREKERDKVSSISSFNPCNVIRCKLKGLQYPQEITTKLNKTPNNSKDMPQ